MVYLQQDAFDSVDSAVPLERQQLAFSKIYQIVKQDYAFAEKEEARDFFTRLTGLFKNFNYAAPDAPDYEALLAQIDELASTKRALA